VNDDALARLDAARRRLPDTLTPSDGWIGGGVRPTGEGEWVTLTVRLPASVEAIVSGELHRLMRLGVDEVNAWEYMAVLSSLTPLESVS
jgi:hypothetical protein